MSDPTPSAGEREQHLATTRLLEEVYAYLLRLPGNAFTVQMARKVRDHLDAPDQAVAQAAALLRRGSYWSAAGVPLLSVVVRGDRLRAWAPYADSSLPPGTVSPSTDDQLVKLLKWGVTVDLRPGEGVFDAQLLDGPAQGGR